MPNSLLSTLNLPDDIASLTKHQKVMLAQEIRETIIKVVTKNGGHLAPSLGVVELTIALLSCFDVHKDSIIWDVGHQSYPWKLLTGRANSFHTLRRYGGISGFPNRTESPYDRFGVGHASTSISAALGMAVARDLQGKKDHVVAIIGDGALSGGMAFEALNQAGGMGKRIIVILNDNKMSISESTGALSRFLSRSLSRSSVMHFKQNFGELIKSLPNGDSLLDIIKRGERSFKSFFTPGVLFEALQFNYIGPINGHDTTQLEKHLNMAKKLDMPVLLHVRTQKGKGYKPAEQDPCHFHGISASVPDEIITPPRPQSSYLPEKGFSKTLGETLCELAKKDSKIVAITAAMPEGTGLDIFQQHFPERFTDVGICEEHAVTYAAGLATKGFHPVVAIYSTFMQRAFDQIIHDVCLQKLPVTLCLDRAGLVGEDGPTHHGAFDLSWLRTIPNLHIAAPRDEAMLKEAIGVAVNSGVPFALRYPRGTSRILKTRQDYPAGFIQDVVYSPSFPPMGQGQWLTKASEGICIIAAGERAIPSVEAALIIFNKWQRKVAVYDVCRIKPLPKNELMAIAQSYSNILFVEDNSLAGGFSSAVLELFVDNNVLQNQKIRRLGLPDEFVRHGPVRRLRHDVGINVYGIVNELEKFINIQ